MRSPRARTPWRPATTCRRPSRPPSRATACGCFKVKVGGNHRADLDRLARVGDVLDRATGGDYRVTLDGNEQFADTPALRAFWEELVAGARHRRLRPSRRVRRAAPSQAAGAERGDRRRARRLARAAAAHHRRVGRLARRGRACPRRGLRRRSVQELEGRLQGHRQRVPHRAAATRKSCKDGSSTARRICPRSVPWACSPTWR